MAEEKEFLGRWKSGRVWKTPVASRSSSKVATVGVKGHSWAEKLAKRQKAEMEKALLEEIRVARTERQAVAKSKRDARKKRKEASANRVLNTHQIVHNSNKLKRLTKKQKAKLIKQ